MLQFDKLGSIITQACACWLYLHKHAGAVSDFQVYDISFTDIIVYTYT